MDLFRRLKDRGLRGVGYVISDAQSGFSGATKGYGPPGWRLARLHVWGQNRARRDACTCAGAWRLAMVEQAGRQGPAGKKGDAEGEGEGKAVGTTGSGFTYINTPL